MNQLSFAIAARNCIYKHFCMGDDILKVRARFFRRPRGVAKEIVDGVDELLFFHNFEIQNSIDMKELMHRVERSSSFWQRFARDHVGHGLAIEERHAEIGRVCRT